MAGDHAVVISDVSGADQVVEPGHRRDGRDGHEMASAEPADLALDAALLVGAFLAWDTEERIEAVFTELDVVAGWPGV